jgi:hypothetical protein
MFTVVTGGILWVAHMTCCQRPGKLKEWNKLVKGCVTDNRPLTLLTMLSLVESEGGCFLTTLLVRFGVDGVRQRNYLSFLLKYKGLSRSGRALMYPLGLAAAPRSYDGWFNDQKRQVEIKSR